MNEIAQTFEIHYVTVIRIVKMKDDFWEMGDLTPLPLHAIGRRSALQCSGRLHHRFPRRHDLQQKASEHRQGGAKKPAQADTDDCPQKSADLKARNTAKRMQRIAQRALQPAPFHSMIGIRVNDQQLDRLAPFDQVVLLVGKRLVLATVNDLHALTSEGATATMSDQIMVFHQCIEIIDRITQNTHY